MKEVKEKVQELIEKSDVIIEKIKVLHLVSSNQKVKNWRTFSSSEVINAVEAALLGKAYLGKTMGELGESTPYKNDGNRKTVADIEPTANKVENPVDEKFTSLSLVEKVDTLRQDIEKVLVKVMELKQDKDIKWTYAGSIYTTSALQNLLNSKMWLGFELGRIRDNY